MKMRVDIDRAVVKFWEILLGDTEKWRYLLSDIANSFIGSVPL